MNTRAISKEPRAMSFLNAMHSSRSHDAVIRVCDEAGDTRLEMHKQASTAPISFAN
jgi:hypothetical protein